MSPTVPIAMFGWIPFGLGLFLFLPVRKAVITGYLIGWLFLPQAGYGISGLPDYTRMTAVNFVMLLGVLMSDAKRLFGVRLRAWDLPMIVWCLCPIPTSLANNLGFYDGLSGCIGLVLTWGVPYWVGRALFGDRQSIRMLAIGVFVGGLICMPLCWWEIRMSPKLHLTLYGFRPTKMAIATRLGGLRPMLFMQHGVAVGVWMCTTGLLGVWLWRAKVVSTLRRLPVSYLAVALLITAILCRSLNAIIVLAATATGLLVARHFKTRVALLVIVLAPALYVCLRANQIWYPHDLVEVVRDIDPIRARSFEERLSQENLLLVKAWQQPVFGWGGYERNRVKDKKGERVVTDALWIITFGQLGLVGLVSLMMAFLLPGILVWRRFGLADLWSPAGAPAAALAVITAMYAADMLMNAMLNPIFHIGMGAVLSFATTRASPSMAARPPARLTPKVG